MAYTDEDSGLEVLPLTECVRSHLPILAARELMVGGLR